MRSVLAIVTLLAGFSPAHIDVGTRLGHNQVPRNNRDRCAIAPLQTLPCIPGLMVGGVKFKIAYDAHSSEIRYLSTDDQQFVTNDGLQVGSWIQVQANQLEFFPGWNIYGPTSKDGWRTILSSGLSGRLEFSDGSVLDLSDPRSVPNKTGKVMIVGFEKGGVR
jgi:hypothetical protein